jgi:hypothetical protein
LAYQKRVVLLKNEKQAKVGASEAVSHQIILLVVGV